MLRVKCSSQYLLASCLPECVFEGCSKTLADEELRSRLAWHLSNCFQQHTGQPPFPYCDAKSAMKICLKNLDRDVTKFILSTFLRRTPYVTSCNVRTQQVAETSRVVEDRVNTVLRYSEAVYEQSKGIAASQVELSEEIVNLRNEAVEIEKEIGKVGDAMFSKMTTLQSKADDIGNMAGTSLDKQKQLLEGQSVALEGLHFLTKFQSQALDESRVTLQKLIEFGQKQQEELLQRQKQLHQSHDHLVENSKLILAAQDYEMLNHKMLLAIMEKVNSMQRTKELLSWDTDTDSEINWSSWVDTELPEDVGLLEDPDYLLPEEVGENSSVTSSSTKRYNLRRRC
ncbi:UNVERIFIED_CONTAM: protein GAMETE EXPRESSED 1 [Sesamum radiatum]|uniref:Protein GAMETE EXPRESSED 1 n=1 Tax=Sesamum radiatum TaxID=300843 RepID=A0AAW2MFJ9_SESRA